MEEEVVEREVGEAKRLGVEEVKQGGEKCMGNGQRNGGHESRGCYGEWRS